MLTIDQQTRRVGPLEMIKAQWRVLVALMLRDIMTRWGSSLGFVMTAAWPLSHILILVALYVSLGRVAPYGDSATLWFSISMVPFMVFSYVSRFVVLGIITNKALLVFPAIKVTDILFSRMIIEVINTSVVIIALICILWYLDVDFIPHDMRNAAYALGVSLLLGLGTGIGNALVGAMFPMWITGYMLLVLVLWLTSGVLFVPNSLPVYLRDLLYFNPCIHIVEWMREAFYSEYRSLVLDKYAITGFSLYTIAHGLFVERMARGRVVIN